MIEEVRYWKRLGIYVTRQFAEEYIERSQESGVTGEYLDEDIDEYEQVTTQSPFVLKREVEEIFSQPFQEVELPAESQVLLDVIQMEQNRGTTLKRYIKEDGMTKAEAKAKYQADFDAHVESVLGTQGGNLEDSEDAPDEEE